MLKSFPVSQQRSSFRVNAQVLQLLAVVFLALAIPLTLAIYGIHQYFSVPPKSPDPDTGVLRATLEQAVDKNWQLPQTIPDDRSIFVLSRQADAKETKASIAEDAKNLNVLILPGDPAADGRERVIVRIPEGGAEGFEARLLRNFQETQHGHPADGNRLYELVFPAP